MHNILEHYHFKDEVLSVSKYGKGHINSTFLVATSSTKYILQKINIEVFKKPIEVMENIELVTKHLKENASKYEDNLNNSSDRIALQIVNTINGDSYVSFQDTYWRCYNYIEDSISYEIAEDPQIFYEVGLAVGNFQKILNDFPVDRLNITIKDFHNTPARFEKFLSVAREDPHYRGLDTFNEIKFLLDRSKCMNNLMGLIDSGEVPIRVTHNDTKLNNILIDENTNKSICVIDLDTVMPGSVLFDFGDAIRVGASTAAEDEVDLEKVKLDLELFEAFTKGFLTHTKDILVEKEIDNLVESARIITLECGMRFLTDYLEKDIYFKIGYTNHNLVRARTQFKLVEEIEENYESLEQIVKDIKKDLFK